MSDPVVREATLRDAETVAVLFSEFNVLLGVDGVSPEDSHSPVLLQLSTDQMAHRMESMAEVERVLLAEVDGDHAGLCCLRIVPYIGQDVPYAEVTQLYVRGAYQRQGIGAALLRETEARAHAVGATCLHIITGRNNLDAQAFYSSQGYRSDDVVFDKYFTREEAHA